MATQPFQLKTNGDTPAQLLQVCEQLTAHYAKFFGYRVVGSNLILYTFTHKDVKGIIAFSRPLTGAEQVAHFVTGKMKAFPEPSKPKQDIPLKLGWLVFTPTDAGGSRETPLEYAFTAKRQWIPE